MDDTVEHQRILDVLHRSCTTLDQTPWSQKHRQAVFPSNGRDRVPEQRWQEKSKITSSAYLQETIKLQEITIRQDHAQRSRHSVGNHKDNTENISLETSDHAKRANCAQSATN